MQFQGGLISRFANFIKDLIPDLTIPQDVLLAICHDDVAAKDVAHMAI